MITSYRSGSFCSPSSTPENLRHKMWAGRWSWSTKVSDPPTFQSQTRCTISKHRDDDIVKKMPREFLRTVCVFFFCQHYLGNSGACLRKVWFPVKWVLAPSFGKDAITHRNILNMHFHKTVLDVWLRLISDISWLLFQPFHLFSH